MGTIEYITLETLKKSDKAIIEVAMMEESPDRVVVKHLKNANSNLFYKISSLHSVYIPKIYKCEQDGERFVIVEEYLEGENLEQYLRSHRLTDKQKLDIVIQLCEAIRCLHVLEPPIIHRDIKPQNIIINEHGALKLIDFDASRYYRNDDYSQDTRLLGTLEYAPPEQYGYSQTDVRSDIYSMGMVFEELKLTEKKFLSAKWEKIVGKCRNFDPKHRYQTVDELEKEIKKIVFWNTITGKTVFGWTTAVLLFLIVLWQGYMLADNKNIATSNQNVVTDVLPSPAEVLQEMSTPEPTATSTPVPTETPTPEQTATSTPVPTETPTPEPATTSAPELTETPTPELTATSTPVPTEMPMPEPTATSTPVPTETPTPEPTATSTPVPTEAPTPELTATSTPVPTETPTPEPTATSTPVPTETPTPKPTATNFPDTDAIKELGKDLNQSTRVYNYYKDSKNDLYIQCHLSVLEELHPEGLYFYEYMTSKKIEVPKDMYLMEYGYIVVSREFIKTLDYVYYEVTALFKGAKNYYANTDVYGIHEFSDKAVKEKVFANEIHYYYKSYPTDYIGLIANVHTTKITGLYIDNVSSEDVLWEHTLLEEVSIDDYQISNEGNWIKIKKEFLQQYAQRRVLYLYVSCDDGSYQPIKIEYENRDPAWIVE